MDVESPSTWITVSSIDGSKVKVLIPRDLDQLQAPLVIGMFIWLWGIPMTTPEGELVLGALRIDGTDMTGVQWRCDKTSRRTLPPSTDNLTIRRPLSFKPSDTHLPAEV